MIDLSDHVALILGGTRMGEATAQALAERGCRTVFGYRSSIQVAERSAERIRAAGGNAWTVPCDLGRKASIERALTAVERKEGRLDILVNLASTYERTLSNEVNPEQGWTLHMDPNGKGSYLVTRLAAPLLRKSPRGRVVLVSDWTSASGRPRYSDYSAYFVSKAAVKSVAEALALEFAPHVLVNAIAPGPMIPPPTMSKQEVRSVVSATPLGRWGGAEEMAKTILFLIETEFVTGETIRLDGGRHLK